MIPEISIVIPLRDEELNVLPMHDELSAVLGALGRAYEIILVDDGSEDGTFEKLADVQARDPHVRVVAHQQVALGHLQAFGA